MTTTRGRGCTDQLGDVGRRARARGGRGRAGCRPAAPGRRCARPRRGAAASAPPRGARCSATSVAPPSVSSTGTTASAPSGIGAPVMIRSTCPGGSTWWVVSPAATSPATGSTTGVCARGAGELGRAHGVAVHRRVVEAGQVDPAPRRRAPSTRPSADPTGTVVAGSGATRASTAARCSARVRIRRRPRGGRRRGCCARRRVTPHVAGAHHVGAEGRVALDAQARAAADRRHAVGEALLERADVARRPSRGRRTARRGRSSTPRASPR